MIMRTEQEADYSRAEHVHRLAFSRENEAALVRDIRSSREYIPELSLTAEDGEDIVGHIMFSKAVIDTGKGEVPTLALAPVAVIPQRQNEGIGSILIREGLKQAELQGYAHAVVLGHPDYYPRFGFRPSAVFGIIPPFPVPEEVFMAIELKESSLAGISGTVKYPPSFDHV
jgi:putative acetyltransferase